MVRQSPSTPLILLIPGNPQKGRRKTNYLNVTGGSKVPPKAVFVESKKGPVTSVVGPFREGEIVTLTCISRGGWPRPRVLWYLDGGLIDDQMDEALQTNILTEGLPNPIPLSMPFQMPMRISNQMSLGISNPKSLGIPYSFLQGPTKTPMQVSPRNTKLQSPKNRIIKGSKKHSRSSNYSVQNTLTLGPLTRSDLKKLVTCESSNTNLTSATSAAVMIDMNLKPLSVQLYGPEEPLSFGKEYEAVCEVTGSRPPPTITWWKAAVRVQGARETTTSDGNMTTSMLTLFPNPEDDGTTITCRAENPATNTVQEQSFPLTVYYVPEAVVSLGSSLDPRNIKERDDVYFECSIQANPRSYKVIWKHNGRELKHNLTAGIIVSNQSLVLQRVTRKHAGRYTCTASNIEGDGTSNPVSLDIKYAPVCAPGQVTTYGVARHEDAEVTCRVAANPTANDFKWTFNNTADTIDVPPGRFTSTPTYSIITYTPMTELDYGTLLCWAKNNIGEQVLPCVFHIVPAGKPDPPANCSVTNQTAISFRIYCQMGFDGGLHQIFHLRVAQPGTQGHTLTSGEPIFQVEQLAPDSTYRLQVWATNDKGSSASVHLTAFTTQVPTHHHTAHVVAEVREGSSSTDGNNGGSSGIGINKEENKGDLYGGVSLLGTDVGGVPALLSVVVGAGVGVLLLLILLIVLIRHRLKHPQRPSPSHHQPSHSVLSTSPQPILKNVHDTSHNCAEREMQVESESEVEPDLIPQPLGQAGLTPSGPLLMPPPNYGGADLRGGAPGGGVSAGGVVVGGGGGGGGVPGQRTAAVFHHPQQHLANVPITPHHQQHLISKRQYQHEITNDPRYAHLDLDEGGQHHIIVPTPKSRLVPTVYATLDTRHSHSRVTFDLRQAQSQASIGHDVAYAPQRGSSGTTIHNPLSDASCDLGYGHHLPPHVHDLGRPLLEDEATPETPLVGKRESSV